MQSWNHQNVMKWINSLPSSDLKPSFKNQIKPGLTSMTYDGSDLVGMENANEVRDSIESITMPPVAKALYNLIQRDKNMQASQIPNPTDDAMAAINSRLTNKYTNISRSANFKLSIQSSNSKIIKLNRMVTQGTAVSTVKQYFVDQEGGDISKLRLHYKHQQLAESNTLGSYGIQNSRCVLIVHWKVKGGTSLYDQNSRVRTVDFNDPELKHSTEPDCIMLMEDPQTVEMPCKHAITPESMFSYIKMIFAKDLYTNQIVCPTENCTTEWPWELCVKVGDLSDEEFFQYQMIINNRTSDTRSCPTCEASVERPEDLLMFRVNCPGCTGGDFCWSCGQMWKASGMQLCGNTDCATKKIHDQLQNCPMKTPSYINIQVPAFRGCPKCWTIIEHDTACKHMKCIRCQTEFCFSCLKPKLNGKWQCGSHTDECPVAPRQGLK